MGGTIQVILKYTTPYLSISGFEDVDLGDFTVLTGTNGSGKTHLLKAIQKGHVTVSNCSPNEVLYFDYRDFGIKAGQGSFQQDNLDEIKLEWSREIDHLRKRLFANASEDIDIERQKSRKEVEQLAATSNVSLLQLSTANLSEAAASELTGYQNALKPIIDSPDLHLYDTGGNEYIEYVRNAKEFADDMDQDDYISYRILNVRSNSILPQNLSSVFISYRVLEFERVTKKLLELDDSALNSTARSDLKAEFLEKYPRPWDVVNTILEKFGPNGFSVTYPAEVTLDGYISRRHAFNAELLRNGQKISFNDLSSGETVLVALALSVYHSDGQFRLPKLLLLDEIDATLHPSNIERLVNVLEEYFPSMGTSVILATHSPSTVALSPEKSLWIVDLAPEIGQVSKASTNQCLSLLTEGFASVSVSDSVFRIQFALESNSTPVLLVEGITDKLHIETAWKKLFCDEPIPFVVQDFYDCYFIQNTFARSEVFSNYPEHCFVGLLDFDSAVDCWKRIRDSKKFIEMTGAENTLKSIEYKAALTLLPVPENRAGYADINYGSHLDIELYYSDEVLEGFVKTQTIAGGVTISKFQDKKKLDFAQSVSGLDVECFQNFKLIFDHIRNVCSILDS